MAYSDQDILEKIGDLLVEINEHYTGLKKDNLSQGKTEILLLAAQAKYLAAHFEALASAQNVNVIHETHSGQQENKIQEQKETFTPAVDHQNQEADDQPVIDEIQEVEQPLTEENNEAFVEEYEEETPTTSTYAEDSNIQDQEIKAEEQQEIAEETNLSSNDQEETTQEITEEVSDFKDFNISSNPIHTASSGYTSVVTAHDAEQEKFEEEKTQQEEIKSEPVINEVVIEQKEVSVEAENEKEVSLNDLAKQAEVKPSRPLTLNELIQQQKKAGLTNTSQFNTSQDRSSDKIGDLKVAVSLNDKLLFIKDLFNGYSLAYSEAIELLNRFDNFAEADAFLQSNYSLKNNWAAKPQTVDKLYAILRKKYL